MPSSSENWGALADRALTLCQKPRGRSGRRTLAAKSHSLLKLPPVFTANEKQGRHNLIVLFAMLGLYHHAESTLRLADLPELWNALGGQPTLSERDVRKLHNWLQTGAFAIRAAILDEEEGFAAQASSMRAAHVARMVYRRLSAAGIPFVTWAQDSPYQLRPLRYATEFAAARWIEEERQQRRSATLSPRAYGAHPNEVEWSTYGLSGQVRVQVRRRVQTFLDSAAAYEQQGRYEDADETENAILEMICGSVAAVAVLSDAIKTRGGRAAS